jgi:hypothetical protein
MEFKYIIFEYMGCELPIIFSSVITHSDVAKGYVGQPISAGEVLFLGTNEDAGGCYESNVIEVKCSGESTTLKLKSRPDIDSELIQRIFRRQWH